MRPPGPPAAGRFDRKIEDRILSLYGKSDCPFQKKRIQGLWDRLARERAAGEAIVTRAPGRTELGGNHTDHNRGRVLTAAISLDIMAAAVATDDHIITLSAADYKRPIVIDFRDTKVKKAEAHTAAALVRGVAHYLAAARGERRLPGARRVPGGFRAELHSTLPMGAGLSSSAAFAMLIGTILNELYGLGLTPVELAFAGRKAENEYYGKPCGLMDQIASACGGVVAVDFKNPARPVIETLSFDPEAAGYALLAINTGGGHAGLTAAYAAIPAEMRAAAAYFGKDALRAVPAAGLLAAVPALRQKTGDRAVLRALHFFQENDRVGKQAAALKRGDSRGFLALVKASRHSSWEQLQNCQQPGDPRHQNVALGLALSDAFLKGDGAARVHGGGFAGTIQCYVPLPRKKQYLAYMESVFGTGSVIALRLCPRGALRII